MKHVQEKKIQQLNKLQRKAKAFQKEEMEE